MLNIQKGTMQHPNEFILNFVVLNILTPTPYPLTYKDKEFRQIKKYLFLPSGATNS